MICPTRLGAAEFPKSSRTRWSPARTSASSRTARSIFLRRARRLAFYLGDREGGSTITQQLARSLFLKKEDRLERKLLEAVWRSGFCGADAERNSHALHECRAACAEPVRLRRSGALFFRCRRAGLTLAEAALLVGMLPEPNNRDPLKTSIGRLRRRNRASAHGRCRARSPPSRQRGPGRAEAAHLDGGGFAGATCLCAARIRPYRDLAPRGRRARTGSRCRQTIGSSCLWMPSFSESFVKQIVDLGAHQGAGFFMRPSGEVLALAGSCTYTGEWNRATDIGRSIGSTGKLFPLIGVHEAGISLNERFSTRPFAEVAGRPSQIRGAWKRAVTLDFALAQSCNRPWTEVAMWLGPRLTEIVERFDMGSPVRRRSCRSAGCRARR